MASYARYSSTNQSDKSIADQLRECHDFAQRHGWSIPSELEFTDEAVSGTKLRREGLDRLREAAKNREFDVLLTYSVSRLARESAILLPLIKELVHVHRIRVISITDGIDSQQPGWEMAAGVCSLMAETYVKELSANVHRGQVGTVLAQFSVGDWRFGYKSVPSPGGEHSGRGRNSKPRMVYRIDEEQARWVRQIFTWFVQERQPIDWIVRELNKLSVPKGPRAQKSTWKRHNVIGILRSPKYVGLWTWGLLKNERDPATGNVSQGERPQEQTDEWLREFPDLRIIDDSTFVQAQDILDENDKRCQEFRGHKGRLCGSSGQNGRKHLLSGLIQCGCCQKIMHVGGTYGRYFLCPGAREGTCESRTQLPKAIAEKLVLNTISERIVGNEEWTDAIFDALVNFWERELAARPDEERELKAAIENCNRKVELLLDRIESSDSSGPEIEQRLTQRRVERRELESRLKTLQSNPVTFQHRPTREWVEEMMKELASAIGRGTPAAAEALRELLCGTIVVDEFAVPGKKRKYYIGTFVMRTGCVGAAATASPQPIAGTSPDDDEFTEKIRLEFRDASRAESRNARAWELYTQGKLMSEIARELGVGKSKMTAIIRETAQKRGEPIVDGRKRRSKLARKQVDSSEHDQRLADVKRLYDQNLPNQEIAKQLGICRDVVTRLVREWHEAHGLSVVDGRTRYAQWVKSSGEGTTKP